MYVIAGYVPASPVIPPLLILLAAWVVQSLALLGTTRLPTIANGILIFALFAMGLIGGIVEQLGSVLDNAAMVNIGIISSLVIPSRAIFEMASARLISDITSPMPGGAAGGSVRAGKPAEHAYGDLCGGLLRRGVRAGDSKLQHPRFVEGGPVCSPPKDRTVGIMPMKGGSQWQERESNSHIPLRRFRNRLSTGFPGTSI